MKKRLLALILVAVTLVALLTPTSSASPVVMFMAVDDTILALRDSTMPAYVGTTLYVSPVLFQNAGITVGLSSAKNNLYVYTAKRQLNFFISLGEATDQNGTIYEDAAVERINGQYYLPLNFVCDFFDLGVSILPNDPVSVIRVTTENAIFNDKTLLGHYKNDMQRSYDAYISASTTPLPIPSWGATETQQPVTHADVTIFLSFYATSAGHTETILEQLENQNISAIFYMTDAEIFANPELARRIACEGHTLGVWLETDAAEEYAHAKALLYEAAFVVTPFVSSPPEVRDAVRALADAQNAIYLRPTTLTTDKNTAATIIQAVPVTTSSRAELRFACSERTTQNLPLVLSYLRDLSYTVRSVTETHHI